MMRRGINYILLILPLFLILACGRRIECSEFNNDVLNWIPYRNGDSIVLSNKLNDSLIILQTKSISIDHTTHYMTDLDCGTCDDNIMVNDFYLLDSTDLYINIHLKDNSINYEFYAIRGSRFYKDSDYVQTQSYLFNDKTYYNVKIFKNNTTEGTFIQLILAKGLGIIGLTEKNGNIWVMQPSSLKSLKSDTIAINNISCD